MINHYSIFSSVWAIEPLFAQNYLPLLTHWLKGETTANTTPPALEAQQAGSVAVVAIGGVMTKHDRPCEGLGALSIASIITALDQSPEITGIVLRIDSGGGQMVAMAPIHNAIARRTKPIIAFVDDCCCSAAYGAICNADLIIANNPLAQVGSIGTLTTLIDYSDYYAKQGIQIAELYATQSTEKNREFRSALAGDTQELIAKLDRYNEAFLSTVSQSRGDKLSDNSWQNGQVFFAQEALGVGLVDAIDSYENVLTYFNP